MNITPMTSPVTSPFELASEYYRAALTILEPSGHFKVNPRVQVSSALQNVTAAVELLTPFADMAADPFTGRAAAASIDAAKGAVASLNTAMGTIDRPGSQLSFEQLVGIAKSRITVAEQALWME